MVLLANGFGVGLHLLHGFAAGGLGERGRLGFFERERAELAEDLLLDVFDHRGFGGGDAAVAFGDEIGETHDDGFELAEAFAEGRDLVEGADAGIPLETVALGDDVMRRFAEWFAFEGLAPDVFEKDGGELHLFGAPDLIGAGDGDEDFDEQTVVEVAHELEEVLRAAGDEMRVLGGAVAGGGEVEFSAIAEGLAELGFEGGCAEVRHVRRGRGGFRVQDVGRSSSWELWSYSTAGCCGCALLWEGSSIHCGGCCR